MEIEKLTEWNPWWEDTKQIEKLAGHPRKDYEMILKSADIKEITIILGVRRCGKSTLMYQIIKRLLEKGTNPKNILFINFDDKNISKDNLDSIYESYRSSLNPKEKAYIFFDEIHKKEGWESWIRKKYDTKTNDKFIVSGSCSYLLKKEYSNLLTGRNITFEIFPLNFEEYLSFNNIPIEINKLKEGIMLEKTKILIGNNFYKYLEMGGFPEVVLKEENFKKLVLKQYFDDILYKDIIERYNLNSQKTGDLALFLITNFTNEISLRNLRNSLGIAYDSIKDYISYFKEAYLFFTLEHFSYSLKEQKTLPSKIYCIDNGLRNAVSFKFSKDYGKLAENLVYLNLRKQQKEVFYWKNKKQEEIDFIVKNLDNTLTAINVTYTDEINEREIKPLVDLKKSFHKSKIELIIITKNMEKEELIEKNKIKFIPLWKWLLENN